MNIKSENEDECGTETTKMDGQHGMGHNALKIVYVTFVLLK